MFGTRPAAGPVERPVVLTLNRSGGRESFHLLSWGDEGSHISGYMRCLKFGLALFRFIRSVGSRSAAFQGGP